MSEQQYLSLPQRELRTLELGDQFMWRDQMVAVVRRERNSRKQQDDLIVANKARNEMRIELLEMMSNNYRTDLVRDVYRPRFATSSRVLTKKECRERGIILLEG